MAMDIVRTETEEQVYSPFTGQPAEGLDGPNTSDPSLLFIHYGNSGEYAYIADRVREAVAGAGVRNVEDLDPRKLAARIDVPGGFVLKIDGAWNGVNSYEFAPPTKE